MASARGATGENKVFGILVHFHLTQYDSTFRVEIREQNRILILFYFLSVKDSISDIEENNL